MDVDRTADDGATSLARSRATEAPRTVEPMAPALQESGRTRHGDRPMPAAHRLALRMLEEWNG